MVVRRSGISLRAKTTKKSNAENHNLARFEFFNAVEQSTMKVLSSSGQRMEKALEQTIGDKFSDQYIQNNELQANKGTIFQAILSKQVRQATDTQILREGLLSDLSVLEVFKNPSILVEFSRKETTYLSRIFDPENSLHDDNRYAPISSLFNTYCRQDASRTLTQVNEETFDTAFAKRFQQLTTDTWEDLPGLKHTDSKCQTRFELCALMSPLARHLFGAYANMPTMFGDQSERECSSQLRANLGDWYRRLVDVGGLNRTQLITNEFQPRHDYDEPVNVLPYVAIEALDESYRTIMVTIVEPIDLWFIDDRVPRDMHIPSVSIGFYEMPAYNRLTNKDLRESQIALRSVLASLNYRMMAQNRGDTLALAAGEASRISRYWYNEGMARLFDHDLDIGGLEEETTLEFWERFVEEILCADIPGITEVEVYPFDRVILIDDVGTRINKDKSASQRQLELTILEAGVRSIAPKDQGAMLTSMERLGRDLGSEFDLTRKAVKFRSKVTLYKNSEHSNLMISARRGDSDVNSDLVKEELIKQGTSDTENAANLTLQSLEVRTAHIREHVESGVAMQAMNKLRSRVSDRGTLYAYDSGIRYSEDAVFLLDVLKVHFELMGKDSAIDMSDAAVKDIKDFVKKLDESSSKIVTFAFDPEMAEANRISNTNGKTYLDPKRSITLILMADEDVEKSVQDINAEREDLDLLLNMIVRQMIQDKRKEYGILHNRFETVRAMLEGVFHKINSLDIDTNIKAQIISQWKGAQYLMEEEDRALQNMVVKNAGELFFALMPHNLNEEDYGLKIKTTSSQDLISEAHLMLKTRAEGLIKSFMTSGKLKKARDVKLIFDDFHMPEARIGFPQIAITECFDVLFKNALEATIGLPATIPAVIRFSVEVRPARGGEGSIDLRIDNSYNSIQGISADVWNKLTSAVPEKMGKNALKESTTGHSTGVGVFAARQLLQRGYGSGEADIFYEPLGGHMIRARMSLPCKIKGPKLLQSDETNAETQLHTAVQAMHDPAMQDNVSILYVEDSEEFYREETEILKDAVGSRRMAHVDNADDARKIIERHQPAVVATDIQIYGSANNANREAQAKFGISVVSNFVSTVMAEAPKEDAHHPICIILTGGDVDEVEKQVRSSVDAKHLADLKIVGRTQPWSGPLPDGHIYIMSGLKRFSDYDELLQLIKARVEASTPISALPNSIDIGDVNAQDELPLQAEGLDIARVRWIATERSLDEAIQTAYESDQDATIFLKLNGESFEKSVAQWLQHEGLPDVSLRDRKIWPLHNADYNQHIVGTVTIPESLDSLPLRYWLLRSKLIDIDVAKQWDDDHWARFKNESGGFMSRLRHDVRNIRIDTPRKELFQSVETTTKQIEDLLQFDSKGELKDFGSMKEATLCSVLSKIADEATRDSVVKTDFKSGLNVLKRNLHEIKGQIDKVEQRPAEPIVKLLEMLDIFGSLLCANE